MNDIRDLLPNRMRERTFQLKAKRDAGAVWHEPQFVECKQCGRRAARTLWGKSLYVCPNCGVHLAIGAYYRLSTVLDHGTFKELNPDIAPNDVLHFPDYQKKLAAAVGHAAANINHVCRRINQTGRFYDADIAELKARQEEIWSLLKEAQKQEL